MTLAPFGKYDAKIHAMQLTDQHATVVAFPPDVMDVADDIAPPIPGRAAEPLPEIMSRTARLIDLTSVIAPLGLFAAAAYFLWGRGLNWLQLGLMTFMYLITGFGVTVGFHRLFTHKSFKTPRSVRIALAILGSMSVQGPLLWWVAVHRQHHHHSDSEGDPHSPRLHGSSIARLLAGAWHSHVGWLFKSDSPTLSRYVLDLLRERPLERINAFYPFWVAVSLLLPALLGGLLTMTWMGALWGFLWGGIARVFLVHHVTWSVNSVCHIWGSRPYATDDHSRNNAIVGVLALGEGWHNNHHAFPTSARHGLRWWQFDSTYWVIRAMAALGLASNVKVPAMETIIAKKVESE